MRICNYCDKRIDFQKMESGNWMPVNPEQINYEDAKAGQMLATFTGRLVTVEQDVSLSIVGREPHFATCPNYPKKDRKNQSCR